MTDYFDLVGNVLVAEPVFGAVSGHNVIEIHGAEACAGTHCPFHNPSDHPLRNARMIVRMDKGALVERLCEHGIGHDDPDSLAYFHRQDESWLSMHGCDGCCKRVPEGES